MATRFGAMAARLSVLSLTSVVGAREARRTLRHGGAGGNKVTWRIYKILMMMFNYHTNIYLPQR